jgi:putative phosphonate metabolism protein
MLYAAAMSEYPRYAIYFAPDADRALTRFGAETLGYDAYSGHEIDHPKGVLADFPDWAEMSADPRKYGFHGTLKAPFPLANDKNEADLLAAIDEFAGEPREIPIIAPVVRIISGFTAIVPSEPDDDLQLLAEACVREFDAFRAPMSAEDRARRKPDALTPRQIEHLDDWGYPYVFEDFRFHMTLTGRLTEERGAAALAMLQHRFAELDIDELPIDSIALFKQDNATTRFRIIKHVALTEA